MYKIKDPMKGIDETICWPATAHYSGTEPEADSPTTRPKLQDGGCRGSLLAQLGSSEA